MTEVLTSAQMRTVEAAAIAAGAVTGLDLMERAGRGVVDAVFAHWPALATAPHRAAVLCGPGNNGGDGFVVARLLHEWGWTVDVFVLGDPARLPPDARANYERWARIGAVAPLAQFDAGAFDYAAGFDAVFGTGLSRPVAAEVAGIVAALGALPRVVAVDIPSGCCADSGRILTADSDSGGAVAPRCQLTVTFQFAKIGHVLASGPEVCGRTVVCDIGLDQAVVRAHPRGAQAVQAAGMPNPSAVVRQVTGRDCRADAGRDGSPLSKDAAAHKFGHGHALVLSGGAGHGGAARLSARGALRIGAGLVTLGCPPSALIENAAQLNAVMLRRIADGGGLAQVLAADARITALCLGPGLGLGERQAGLVRAALGGAGDHPAYGGAVVLDGDALTCLARDPALFALLHRRCVLTPHGGEFARLFPDIAERLAAPARKGPAYSKVDAAREAARLAGCTVLFKGPDTVIAGPDGHCAIHSAQHDRAAPWLATAGSGDVLAGFVTGLLARGFAPMQAAGTAAWLHVECALRFGPGLIAEDLPEQVPGVFRDLGL